MTIEVTQAQFAAIVRGEAAVVGLSKRVVELKDGPFMVKHYGPGPHPGTGTSQDVHGSGGGARGNFSGPTVALRREYERTVNAPGYDASYLNKEFIRSAHDIFKHIPGTARWDRVRQTLDAIDKVHGIDNWMPLPLNETRANTKGGSYHHRDKMPSKFMIKFYDEYGDGVEMSIAHEVGHYMDHWLLGEQEPYAPAWLSEVVGEQYGPNHRPVMGFTNRQDMVKRIQKYPIQIGQSDFDVPDSEVVDIGVSIWDTITDSRAYRDLKVYKPGIKKMTGDELPQDFFDGERGSNAVFYGDPSLSVTFDIPSAAKRSIIRPRENFARAYAQYIALRSGNETMIRQIDETNKFTKSGGMPLQWEWDDFEPIARGFDRLFKKKGWLNPELAK